MNKPDLAGQIAAHIFDKGQYGDARPRRIAFKLGSRGGEYDGGGYCEAALADAIRIFLEKRETQRDSD